MKKQFHFKGFTLVELLVVISIIGMLAGLLLPAVNAAREAGRRATCVNNQSQYAVALINYDNTRGNLPPLRGAVYQTGSASSGPNDNSGLRVDMASWVAFLFPYMEENAAWDRVSGGQKPTAVGGGSHDGKSNIGILALRNYGSPSMKCKSANIESSGPSMSYVVNGGYQNGYGTAANNHQNIVVNDRTDPIDPGKKEDSPFFDHNAKLLGSPTTTDRCTTVCSIDYISRNDGTSRTILLSENLQAGPWFTEPGNNNALWRVFSGGEDRVAYCYPVNSEKNSQLDLTTPSGVYNKSGPLAVVSYYPDNGVVGACVSWRSYTNGLVTLSAGTSDTENTPLFINQGRSKPLDFFVGSSSTPPALNYKGRCARPSSNHPGSAVAAFADRSVTVLNDQMDQRVFVLLCMPAGGHVIDANVGGSRTP